MVGVGETGADAMMLREKHIPPLRERFKTALKKRTRHVYLGMFLE
jgi:hypothetical protein